MTNQTIFISHTTADDSAINLIAESLEKAGHTVWVDHRNGIIPGTPSWDKEIRMAIKNADIGVFVMTEKSLESDICGAECILIRELNKPLYVLRLEICKPENIFLYIKQIQYADLTKNFDTGMASFLEALGGIKSDTMPTAARAKLTGGETMRAYLPFLANPLRGRDADVTHIQAMLTQIGITQIIGVGGWGKSRISAEIALAYPNGAVWHRCSSVSSAGDLLYVLRRHFDLPDDIPQENILALLDTHRPLIVIDNAEDVAPKSDRRVGYVELLNKIAGFGVPILLTSRLVWDELKPRKQYPPPALNGDIAKTITADFAESQNIALTSDQIAELTRVARNHPRLIELAVALLQEALPYDRLIKRLCDLSHEDMQEALNEMILKTVEQMRQEAKHGEDATALLHNLTWLQATFPFEAIQALKPASITTDDALEDAVTTLGRYTFLQFDKNTGRYRLGGLVREALGLPDDEAVFNAYADYYIARAKAIFVDLRDKPELWKNFDDDIVNITALGNEQLIRTQNGRVGDLERASLFALYTKGYIYQFMELEKWDWTEMGLYAVQELRQIDPKSILLQRREASILRAMGYIQSALGYHHKAISYQEGALIVSKLCNDYIGIAWSMNNIGVNWYDLGDIHKALSYYEEAVIIFRSVNDIHGEAQILNNIGLVWSKLRDIQKAMNCYQQALAFAVSLQDKGREAMTLNNMANVELALGKTQKALDYYNQCVSLLNAVGDKYGESTALRNIGLIYDEQGDFTKAIEYQERAIATTFSLDPRLPEWKRELSGLKALRGSGA
jgi:tetratricopeptide (TPR) repeat protein